MPTDMTVNAQLLFYASLVFLALAVLLHARQVRLRLNRINLDELSRRVGDLARQSEEHARDLEVCRRDCAELTMRLKAAEADLAAVKEESARFLGIFKTVLYGFDYIVQGCKNALEVAPADRPGEKRIQAD